MKSYVQLGLAAFMLLASFTVQAQECTPFQFWVMNQAGEGNPVLVINYLISNANGSEYVMTLSVQQQMAYGKWGRTAWRLTFASHRAAIASPSAAMESVLKA